MDIESPWSNYSRAAGPFQGRSNENGDCAVNSRHCYHGAVAATARCCACGTYKDPLLAKVALANQAAKG